MSAAGNGRNKSRGSDSAPSQRACCATGMMAGIRSRIVPRGHRVYHDGRWFNIYCFAVAADAEKFMARFGGEKLDPAQRGKGRNWMQWKK